jgi:integrase/recombinase XerC
MIQEFINWLTYEKRYSAHTVSSYLSDLEQFQNFLSQFYPNTSLQEVETVMIKSWVVNFMDSGLSPTTVNRKLVSLNSFYKYVLMEGHISTNPAASIKGPKQAKRLVKYLEEDEIQQVLDNFEFEDNFNGVRDNLIIEMLYGTGIRLAELISLKLENLSLETNSLKVLGKRNKERIIPINNTLQNLIKKYLTFRKEIDGHLSNANLLITEKAKDLYPMLVYRVVKKYLDQFASRTKVSPHVLRHSFATHLMNRGADINAIKELLGHANLAATQVYTHNTIESLKKVFKQTHPRG